MKRNRLKYAGRGQIVREADGRLVSPRDVVTWFNDLCDVADEMHATLTTILDAMTYEAQKGAGANEPFHTHSARAVWNTSSA